MIGCEYCRVEDNGDIGRNLKEIIQIRRIYEVESQDSECIEEETPDDKYIAIGIYNGYLSYIENGRICVERKVNYCCMCGRKL